MAIPDCPRSVTTTVQILEFLELFECVHTGPETVVDVRNKLPLRDQAPKRLFHQFLSLLDVSEDFPPKQEETTVNPRTCLGNVLDTFYNALSIKGNYMKTGSWLDAHEASQPLALQEFLDQHLEIYVGQTVAVVR
jgi:hypothetical protein